VDLQDKVALVTGSARRVGREIALALARAGCHIAIHYHTSKAEAATAVDEIRSLGRRAVPISADLNDPKNIDPLITRVSDDLGGPDILINNAAIFAPTDWGRSPAIEWERHFRLNALAPFLLAQACWPIFQRQGAGAVVNLSDIYGARPLASHAAYSASKAALDSITQSLARLMAPIARVNAVAPGTALFPDSYDGEIRRRITAKVPLGREGTPGDVADAVLFLLRDADYLTGQTLIVDGGRSLV